MSHETVATATPEQSVTLSQVFSGYREARATVWKAQQDKQEQAAALHEHLAQNADKLFSVTGVPHTVTIAIDCQDGRKRYNTIFCYSVDEEVREPRKFTNFKLEVRENMLLLRSPQDEENYYVMPLDNVHDIAPAVSDAVS